MNKTIFLDPDNKKLALSSRDVLLLLLYAPGRSGKKNEKIEGKLRLAKMIFLLKIETEIGSSVSNFYDDFAPKPFGPYSDEFAADIDSFKKEGLVREEVTEVNSPLEVTVTRNDYTLTEKGVEHCQVLAERTDKNILETIAKVKKRFNSMSIETLVNYVYWKYPDYAKKSRMKDRVY